MTHLRIELNTTGIEEVSGAVIAKLYDLVHSGTLDNTSNLLGRLHTTATYLLYIDYLQGQFDGTNDKGPLYIDATKKYLMFEDPEIERVIIAKNIGDGVGLTLLDLSSITTLSGDFFANTTVTSANDLLYFTSLTGLNGRTFRECTNLTSVKTPSSLITLSDPGASDPAFMGVFKGCTSLRNVILNEGLLEIECLAFNSCTSLLTIDIPSTVIRLTDDAVSNKGYGIFLNCTTLTTVTGGENINKLGIGVFNGCSNLVSIPDIDFSNITRIGRGCFTNCVKLLLGNLNLSSLTQNTIDYGTFYNCKLLTGITLPNTVTIIADVENWLCYGVFRDCTALTTVNAPGLLVIGEYAFYNCTSLTTISSLSNIETIKQYAFTEAPINVELNLTRLTGTILVGTFYNSGITKIKSLGNITSIDSANNSAKSGPFRNCKSLTEVDLSTTTNLTSIGTTSFTGCTSLTTVKLPSSLTSINAWAFYSSASNIQNRSYYIYAATPPTLQDRNSISCTDNNSVVMPAAIYVPSGSVTAYQLASVWSTFASVILAMPTT